MYDWLADSLQNSGTVVTANRRLARDLAHSFGASQRKVGKEVWSSPTIHSWQDWLVAITRMASEQETLPARINVHQSQLLWERCLRKSLDESEAGFAQLAELSRGTWQRLADWQIEISAVASSARSDDQRLFAVIAGRYQSILEREHWVDDAGLAQLVIDLIGKQRIAFPGQYTFVGFDRQQPVFVSIREAMLAAGVEISSPAAIDSARGCSIHVFEHATAEFRAAGAWARQRLEDNPEARVAIIANDLEANAQSAARHIREGATPGWQHAHRSLFDALNVSYGQRLSDFPAIAVALTLIRWLVNDLPSQDVGMLLRSPLLGMATDGGRARLELRLRKLPDRRWGPSMVTDEFRGRRDGDGVVDWLTRLAAFSKHRRQLPRRASPADWALQLDEILTEFAWPGQGAMDSTDFQLINRWRELLNEFARLALVHDNMSAAEAVSRLQSMAQGTLFQPESAAAVVQLMGPMEAAGGEFDALWLTGMTTANWPAATAPSRLLSRRLQQRHAMPDCTPAATVSFARSIVGRLLASGGRVLCSYALSHDDSEQTASDLLPSSAATVQTSSPDPGWYAAGLTAFAVTELTEDVVPPVQAGEIISGGARIIQQQLDDPIAAFVHGRLGARQIDAQVTGIPLWLRGTLIHDALHSLYSELPCRDDLRQWHAEDRAQRVELAVNSAFTRHERNLDAVLSQLLRLERTRIAALLCQLVVEDAARDDFKVVSVEASFEFLAGHVRLPLRCDRIDLGASGGIAILDYKTGVKKKLIDKNHDVQQIQLFVYAAATEAAVSALALVSIDSREISFDGVGLNYSNEEVLPDVLRRANEKISLACNELSAGDVRLNIRQSIKSARPLNLLTRFTELRRGDG